MIKIQEIEILKEAATKLGKDSYCGEWLAFVIPMIERDIQSDLPPINTPEQARKDAAEIIDDAKEEAKKILDNATKNAQRIGTDVENARTRARAELFRIAQGI